MKSAIATAVAVMLLVSCVTVKPPTTSARGPGWYTVKRSDTLYSIAWRYGLDYKQLARWNQIDLNSPIHPGQRLRLLLKPGKQVAAGSGHSSSSSSSSKKKTTGVPKSVVVTSSQSSQVPVVGIRVNGSGRPAAKY